MVCARSKGDLNSLMPASGNKGNNLVLLGFVHSTFGKNDRVSEVIKRGSKTIIGDD